MKSFKQFAFESKDPCWIGYRQLGTKKKNGKMVPNCVPKEGVRELQNDPKTSNTRHT